MWSALNPLWSLILHVLPQVCDFGLARDKQGAYLQTIHQGGTLNYIAPEVHRGADVDERCDCAMPSARRDILTLSQL